VQLEFGFLLGPPDGRYLIRPAADALVESVLVLTTAGAPQRARLRGNRPRPTSAAEPEPVPTSRATIVSPTPLPSPAEWLSDLDFDAEVASALGVLNRALRAHRAAAADPYTAEVSRERALVVRIGYGSGDEVADGRFGEAVELPRSTGGRVKRSMEAPEERFAALIGGREEIHPAEELVLRARADLNAGRPAEAALQCRVAIEALLALLKDSAEGERVGAHREAVGAAANEALRGPIPADSAAALEDAVIAMERALKRRRLGA
jgi:hypothetical protein